MYKLNYRWILMLLLCLSMSVKIVRGQSGSFTYTFTGKDGVVITKNTPVPNKKFNDYDTYWFVNPQDGNHHLMINGSSDIGIIILNDQGDADVNFQYKYEGDQINILAKTPYGNEYIRPDNDFGPMHVHYGTMTAGEIDITFDGPSCYDKVVGGATTVMHGSAHGRLHLYREPRYERSADLPGCSCDPTIYAKFYDSEIGRTPSACENAVLWKVYNKVQAALGNVPSALGAQDGGKDGPAAHVGSLIFRLGGNIDLTPQAVANTCDPTNPRQSVVGIYAHQRPFTKDSYGFRIDEMPDLNKYSTGKSGIETMKEMMVVNDSLTKLYMAKRITAEQMNAKLKERGNEISGTSSAPDMNKDQMEYKVEVMVEINATSTMNIGLNSRTVVRHNVPGASLELFTPGEKDSGGNWTPNRLFVCFGKFSYAGKPGQAKNLSPVYAPNVQKLSLFNVFIRIEGGQDLINKIVQNTNFDAFSQLLADK